MRTAFALAFVLASAAAEATPQHFTAGPERATFIELYTSEGCSACLPADQWLASLRSKPGLWKQFVPVEFHVTYWDDLGWKDPLASNEFTARQSAYVESWAGALHTPCFVRNGTEWKPSWGETPGLGPKVGYLILTVLDDGRCVTEFRVGPAAPKFGEGYYVAHVALLGGGISSKVSAGENRGKTLEHEFTVLHVSNQLLRPIFGFKVHRATLTLPRSAPEPGTRQAVAAWITVQGQMVPIQAAGGWLPW